MSVASETDPLKAQTLRFPSQVTVGEVMEAMGEAPGARFHYKVLAFCVVVFVSSGWVGGPFSYIIDALGPVYGETEEGKAMVMAISWAISFIPNILLGPISDLKGRMTILCAMLLLMALCQGSLAFANKQFLLVGFALNAVANNGVPMLGKCLLAEWLPTSNRGPLLASLHGWWNMGRLLSMLLVMQYPLETDWQLFFILQTMPLVLVAVYAVYALQLFESPRWYATRGKFVQCLASLQIVASANKQVLDLKSEQLLIQFTSEQNTDADVEMRAQVMQLWRSPRLRGLFLVVAAMLSGLNYTATGQYQWLIKYMKTEEQLASSVDFAYAMAPFGKITAILTVGLLMDNTGRMAIMKVSFAGMAVACLAMAVVSHVSEKVVWLITAVFLSNLFEECLWFSVTTFSLEMFPTTLRGTANSLLFGVANLAGLLAQASGGLLMNAYGYQAVALSWTFAAVIGFVAAMVGLNEDNTGKLLDDAQ